jgi:glycerophosphoryl diester phosphodiesterase
MTSRTRALGALLLPLVPLSLVATLVAPPSQAAAPVVGQASADRPGRGVEQLARPLVVGHRGASGYRPEHTLAAYRLAVQLGADYIEPDLVPTKDGVLVARHESFINETTDVEDHPEFADRRAVKTIDGVEYDGWFTEDFTLAELRTLRATERLPQVRPDNTRYDGRFRVPTFDEVLALAKQLSRETGRTIGVAPETKHPTYFDSLDLSPEEPMLRDLRQARLDGRRAKILIQSFEVTNLRRLDRRTDLPLEQLMSPTGAPWDQQVRETGVTYADLTTRAGLRDVASYADWIGPEKTMVIPRQGDGSSAEPTALPRKAHRQGLRVVVYTIRDENQFMATEYRSGEGPDAKGDVFAEVADFLDAGVDAVFADHPDSAVFARDNWVAAR